MKNYFLILIIGTLSNYVRAETFIDKIYHPYVEWDTWSIETRLLNSDPEGIDLRTNLYSFGIGKDISEKLKLELYVTGKKYSDSFTSFSTLELELLYQVGEQGEFWADYGLLFEIEHSREENKYELNASFLMEKEYGRWSSTVNTVLKYKSGVNESTMNNSFQTRYRLKRTFEPGIELFLGPKTFALGPVVRGEYRTSNNQLNWELSFLKEMKDKSNERVIKALLEFDF